MNKKKAIATVGIALGVVATALLASPLGSNPTLHMICDTAIKLLAAFGLIAPVSFMAPTSSAKTEEPTTAASSSSSLRALLPLAFLAFVVSGCAGLQAQAKAANTTEAQLILADIAKDAPTVAPCAVNAVLAVMAAIMSGDWAGLFAAAECIPSAAALIKLQLAKPGVSEPSTENVMRAQTVYALHRAVTGP